MRKLNVAVCVPSGGEWKSGFGKSLALMFAYFAMKRVAGVEEQRIKLLKN